MALTKVRSALLLQLRDLQKPRPLAAACSATKTRSCEGAAGGVVTPEPAGLLAAELQTLFPQRSSEEEIALQWAVTNERNAVVEGWLRKCRKWNAVAKNGSSSCVVT